MIPEHDCARLVHDLPALGLAAGAIGTVVHAYDNGGGYLVEFFDQRGDTIGVDFVAADGLRALTPEENAGLREQRRLAS